MIIQQYSSAHSTYTLYIFNCPCTCTFEHLFLCVHVSSRAIDAANGQSCSSPVMYSCTCVHVRALNFNNCNLGLFIRLEVLCSRVIREIEKSIDINKFDRSFCEAVHVLHSVYSPLPNNSILYIVHSHWVALITCSWICGTCTCICICKMASCVCLSTSLLHTSTKGLVYFSHHIHVEYFLLRSKTELGYTVFPEILELILFLEGHRIPEI